MPPSHVVVNARLLLPHSTEGIARFATEVLRRMTTRHPEVRFSFLFDRPFDESFIFSSNVVPYVVSPPARHPLLWYAWFHQTTPRKVIALKPDVYFSPELYLCPYLRVPKVAVFHDVAYEHYPEILSWSHGWYLRHYSPIYQAAADHILTVSEFNRQDIHQVYGTPLDKLSVAYNGVSEGFHPLHAEAQQATRNRFAEGNPYFLFVGTMQPRKNLTRLLQAFDRFKSQWDTPMRLLIVGKPGFKHRELQQVYAQMTHRDAVTFTGRVSATDLNALYASALALTFVPLYEGFGLPIVEAMRAGTAVLCAQVSAMPEIYGEAAYGVDPLHVPQIAEGMAALYQDAGLRSRLIQQGFTQQAQFTWDRCYESAWAAVAQYLP
jgi:glycosyltransferase involved in cell wall biosynthesis